MEFMCWILAFLAVFLFLSPASAQGGYTACVSQKEMSDIVAARKFIAPTAAVVTARRHVANSDVVRADLCRRGDEFVYVIVTLKKDGRAEQVFVNPESGKVTGTQ